MLFVTDEFLIFFLIVYVLFWLVSDRLRIPLLIGASLFFYATWSFIFTFHLLLVVVINYLVMELWRIYGKKWIFVLLQIANVANIGVFKYYYFFADVIGRVIGNPALYEENLRQADRLAGSEIFLPLAISFYTFQIMAYGFDMYRGTYTERHSFSQVLLFKSFFPQLIAGPIMRSNELLPQIRQLSHGDGPRPDFDMHKKGLWLVLIGITKKVLIADQIVYYVSPLFYASTDPATPFAFDPLVIWLGVLGCLAMLYADFSAYSDLARGFGYLLGFEIPINFKAPLFMTSISDFWRRWHLTFSRWIRDYIFIPLGGSRVSEGRVYLNYTITFAIGGLWHGASYPFLIWGVGVGLWISIENFLEKRGLPMVPENLAWRGVRVLIAWIFLLVSSIFFFGPGAEYCWNAVAQMFHVTAFGSEELRVLPGVEPFAYALLATLLFHLFEERPAYFTWLRRYENWLLPAAAVGLVIAITQFAGQNKDFFYFQF
jgi:alginate O-acetyltransferase complex protein AlgI